MEDTATFISVALVSVMGLTATNVPHRPTDIRQISIGGYNKAAEASIVYKPLNRLSGKIILSDGNPLPNGLGVHLSGNAPWGYRIGSVAADGSFEFNGVPKGTYELYLRVPGYYVSPKNRSHDHSRLIGIVEGDLKDLEILFEPGKPPKDNREWNERAEEHVKRRSRPLQGISR